MDKTTLIKSLDDSAAQFIELVKGLNKDEFEVNVNNKWSAGQDLVHLIKVLQIVNIGFTLPKPILRLVFGINKKESRSFEDLRQLYKNALEGGAKAPTIYIPKPVSHNEKDSLIQLVASISEPFAWYASDTSTIAIDTLSKLNLQNPLKDTIFYLKTRRA